MSAMKTLSWTVLVLALGCGVRSSGDGVAVPVTGGGGEPSSNNEPTCPPLGTSCSSPCDAIQARGVDTRASAAQRCRRTKATLGCFARSEDETDRDACVIDQTGRAFGTSPSAAAHLTANGYRSCTKEEQELWTSAPDCE